MSEARDPRAVLDGAAMTWAQVFVVAITVMLNATDGFDILSIAFASPGIAAEWGIAPLQLGVVLSMELIGMGLGSLVLGGLADKVGRRPVMLGCLAVMSAGMLGATTAGGPLALSVWRVMTGAGIGGMLSAINPMVAEVSNARWRNVCISLMVIGNPLGGGIGGLFATRLIAQYDWRAVFYFGAAVTAMMLPVVYLLVPESVHWLARRRPVGAVERINRAMRALGHGAITGLGEEREEVKAQGNGIFAPELVGRTAMVTLAFFAHIVSFYFLVKWAPKIVTDMGFAAAAGGRILTMANFGGAAGGLLFGLLAAKVGLRGLSMAVLAMNAAAIVAFARAGADAERLLWAGVAVGFFGNAAVTGLFSLAAHVFPAHLRATGTGFVIGVGRGGAIVSPWIAGWLFESGTPLASVGLVMAVGSAVAAVLLAGLRMGVKQERSLAGEMRAVVE